MKSLLKIELFRIGLNIVFCIELKILCKIALGTGILTSVVRVSIRFPVNKRRRWILETVEFMDVTDGRYR